MLNPVINPLTRTFKWAKSWPLTIVAVLYRLQGLIQTFSAIIDVGAAGQQTVSGGVTFAVIDGVSGILFLGAGVGLLARFKKSLAVATFLAAFNLFGTGGALIEAAFGPQEWRPALPVVLVLVLVASLQYITLRNESTIARFSKS